MDPAAKKRKSDENVATATAALTATATATAALTATLTLEDARKILEPFTQEQLLDIVAAAMCRGDDPAVLAAVRAVADRDPAQRKLFIRGLGWETTNDSLRAVFTPFGELEEAVVIADKATGRSKGYGFITYRHIDGALLSLKEPSKKIDGRMAVTQLAATGSAAAVGTGIPASAADVSQRKIYVGNVPPDMSSDRLLAHFASYGEIEEGPLGFDKQTGKFRGYALFVYKTLEAARASLVDPTKTIDGHHLVCKLANTDPKKVKPGVPGTAGAPIGAPQGHTGGPGTTEIAAGNGLGLGPQSSLPGSLPNQYGIPGSGLSSFSGHIGSGFPGAGGLSHHHSLNSPLQSSVGVGTPGLSSAASQVHSSLSSSSVGGYSGGLGGSYGSSLQYGAPGSGGYAGLSMGPSMYRMPPASTGMPSGGYSESGQYSISSSAYQTQHHQQAGSPGRRYPSGGGMYPNLPPYY